MVNWWLNLSFAAPDHPDCGVFTPQGNIVCWFDRAFVAPLGRITPGTERLPFDNQTALSTLMAMVTAMLGVFTGEFVRTWRGRIFGERGVPSRKEKFFSLMRCGGVCDRIMFE